MKTILVAEDEESNYELVRIVLHKRYRLLRAHNGIEAVTINEDEHPDLILMDIRMPEMNGLDATRIIKEVNHSTPVIALSAYAFPENINEAHLDICYYHFHAVWSLWRRCTTRRKRCKSNACLCPAPIHSSQHPHAGLLAYPPSLALGYHSLPYHSLLHPLYGHYHPVRFTA